jgi:Nif-specific regulatory protein
VGNETVTASVPAPVDDHSDNLSQEVMELEKKRIIKALRENTFIQNRASLALGIIPRQLGYRIRKYQIDLRRI